MAGTRPAGVKPACVNQPCDAAPRPHWGLDWLSTTRIGRGDREVLRAQAGTPWLWSGDAGPGRSLPGIGDTASAPANPARTGPCPVGGARVCRAGWKCDTVVVEDAGADLEEEVGAAWSPAHLLFLDHAFADDLAFMSRSYSFAVSPARVRLRARRARRQTKTGTRGACGWAWCSSRAL